jgi:hypothetical protein
LSSKNKENIDALISKFRLENQAFSNRVHSLKSKIDTAYTRFSQKPQSAGISTGINQSHEVIKNLRKVVKMNDIKSPPPLMNSTAPMH